MLPQRIQDEMGGKPMNRLLLAQALGVSPSSSGYRDLLSSAFKYGLTDGTEKADNISLTTVGASATQPADQAARLGALQRAAMTPPIFGQLFRDYANKRLPSAEMLPRILQTQYKVPGELTEECADNLATNGRFVDIVRDIGGSPHVLLDADLTTPSNESDPEVAGPKVAETPAFDQTGPLARQIPLSSAPPPAGSPKPIFVGHGKNKGPLQQLQRLLATFQIPHKVVIDEANLGRPISQKVKETIEECGSAILIFTRDERFFDESGNEVWRPSENVVHERGDFPRIWGSNRHL